MKFLIVVTFICLVAALPIALAAEWGPGQTAEITCQSTSGCVALSRHDLQALLHESYSRGVKACQKVSL